MVTELEEIREGCSFLWHFLHASISCFSFLVSFLMNSNSKSTQKQESEIHWIEIMYCYSVVNWIINLDCL
jgi:hypothetical protein